MELCCNVNMLVKFQWGGFPLFSNDKSFSTSEAVMLNREELLDSVFS